MSAATPTSDAATGDSTQPEELPYTVVHDDTFVGVAIFAEAGTAYPDLGEFRRTGMGPIGNGFGSMRLYRRNTADGSEEMVVMWTGPDRLLVDALRLTGDARDVRLLLSCEARAALLVPAGLVSGAGRFIGDFDDVLRAWRPGPAGALEEFDAGVLAGVEECGRPPVLELPDVRATSDDPSYTVETAWEYLGFAGPLRRSNTYEGLLGDTWDGSEAFGSVGSDRAVVVYHRDLVDGHEDLAIVIAHDDQDGWISDALLLVDAPSDVHLAFSCAHKAVALLDGTTAHGCGSTAGALHVWTVNDDGHFVERSAADAVVEIRGPTPLTAGTSYSTDTTRTPILRFAPDRFGWTASDSVACGTELGTLRLHHQLGWVYVVPTPDLTVDEAVDLLLEQPIADAEVAGTMFAGLGSGRRITGVLEDDVEFPLGELLPYHHVVEDGLPTPMLLGDRIDVHVVASDEGIVTVVLASHDGVPDHLRDAAMPMLDTLELVSGSGIPGSCPA